MPKYTFKCECGYSAQKIVDRKTKSITCPDCNSEVKRQMPILSGPPEVRESVGEFNKSYKKDNDRLIEHRKQEYYWKHEVPKFVNSGTYTVETMLENQWIYFDDKGQMHIRTKPPGKG